jgi:hypothetical protein
VGLLLGVQVEDVLCEEKGEGFGFHFGWMFDFRCCLGDGVGYNEMRVATTNTLEVIPTIGTGCHFAVNERCASQCCS